MTAREFILKCGYDDTEKNLYHLTRFLNSDIDYSQFPDAELPEDFLEGLSPEADFQEYLDRIIFAEEKLNKVFTAPEAAELWGLDPSTVKKSCQQGRFTQQEARKSGGVWLVTHEGMERVYGPNAGNGCDKNHK
jgi:hypothetical protein